jgi:hypothetical protein
MSKSNVTYRKTTEHDYYALIEAAGQRVTIAHARLSPKKRYIRRLVVAKEFRRSGVAIALVRHIVADLGYKLHRAPSRIKNDAVKALSAKLGDELLHEEAEEEA